MKKKILLLVLCLLTMCLLAGCGCEHEWAEANCLEPRTCGLCGDVEGEALGHGWKEAACETPKTCSRCDITEGEALGHDWQEAACETPKTCGRCDLTEGEALGHDWQEISCEEPLSCPACGACGDEPIGHSYGEWAPDHEVMSRSCPRCENVETVPVDHELIGTQWLLGSWTSVYTEVAAVGGVNYNAYTAQFLENGEARLWIDEELNGTWEWDTYRLLDDGTECYDFLTYIENIGFQTTIVPDGEEKLLGFWIAFADYYVYVEYEKDEPADGEALPGQKIDNLI